MAEPTDALTSQPGLTWAVALVVVAAVVLVVAAVAVGLSYRRMVRERRRLRQELALVSEQRSTLLASMQSPALQHDGLVAAIRTYASELYGDRSGTLVRVEIDPALVLDRSTETITYRIVQEALDNASRHAMAPSVEVRVHNGGATVVVEIEDDGVGCDLASVTHRSGLASMQLYAGLGYGTLAVESVPRQGTVVRAVLGVDAGC